MTAGAFDVTEHSARAARAPAGTVQPLAIRRVACDAWDAAVAAFDGICQEQTSTFALRRWPSLDHEPLLFLRDRDVVGGVLMMVQRLPLRMGTIAVGKWGPMLKDAQRADGHKIYQGMVEALIRDYAHDRGMMLSILPRRHGHARDDEFTYLLQRGFRAGANTAFPDRYIVDLQRGDDEHRKRLHPKWRYHLNKSEKAGLTFECADGSTFPAFAALYEAMSDRKKFPDYSAYETVPALLSMPEPSLRPQLFFVRKDDTIVAGAVIFTAGDTAVYLYGATSHDALPLRAGYVMHWQIIRWLKQNTRARWYDLGGSDGFLGLHQFKKGMVGDAGAIAPLPPMAHFAARRLPLVVGTGAFAARDALLNLKQRLSRRFGNRATPDQPRALG
jgi:hypothetical protein